MIIFKSLLLLISALTVSPRAFAAIASTTVWEIRGDATAANANGGGFNPSNASAGTDYSQQTGAQFSGSNLASTTGSTTCVVTSASHNFVSTDNGNLIHITAGTNWTQGWYEIVSTSGNAATLDRACGSVASISSGTWSEGGAISLGSSTANQTDLSWSSAVTAGNTVWVRNTTITLAASPVITASSSTLPGFLTGYNATRGDNPTGSNRPTISAGAQSFTPAGVSTIKNLIFTGSASTVIGTATAARFFNVKVVNTSTTAGRSAITLGTNGAGINSEFISYRGIAANLSTVTSPLVGCYIHDSDVGVKVTSGIATLINNIISDNVTQGFYASTPGTGSHYFFGNTFYGAENKLGVGVRYDTGSPAIRSMNNIFYGFTIGFDVNDVLLGSYADYNDYFNDTTTFTNIPAGPNDRALNPGFGSVAQLKGTNASTNSSTLTDSGANFSTVADNVDFLTIVSGGPTAGKYLITSHTTTTVTVDLALGTTASGVTYQITTGHNFAIGTALKFKGFPGAFPGSSTTGYLDTGAAQRHEYGRPVNK